MSETLRFPHEDDDAAANDRAVVASADAAPADTVRPIIDDRTRLLYGLPAVMCWVIGLRVLLFLVGVLSIQISPDRYQTEAATGHPWVAWDGHHYLNLILHGYATSMEDKHSPFYDIAYFPLYPAFCRPLTQLMSPESAMVLVANFCSVVGFLFFYLWFRGFAGAKKAFLATLFMATFPGAVFFSAGLTEGPFFMMVALALWLLQHKMIYRAAIVSGLATLLRPTGIALAIAIGFWALFQYWKLPVPAWQRLGRAMLIGLVSISGGLMYEAFLWHRYQTPTAYLKAQEYWERDEKVKDALQDGHLGPRRYSPQWFVNRAQTPQAWNRAIALLIVAVMLAGFIRPGPIPRVLFLLPLVIFLMTYLPNNGLRASSIIRYETAGLPVFALAAFWLSQRSMRPLMVAFMCLQFALQMYYAVLFSRGVWVG